MQLQLFIQMDQLKHYTEIANELEGRNPQAFETLEEEINILIHKLKFIPMESRPNVLIQHLNSSVIDQDYLEEIMQVAGGKLLASNQDLNEADFLIFIHDAPDFFSKLPQLLETQYAEIKAVKDNQIYIINKANFGTVKSDYLQDIEILAEIVQSKYFIYGHEGNSWVKFSL